jgi:hypothetical protein
MAALARLGGMVPSAYLRVFVPLEALGRSEQLHLERDIVARGALPKHPLRYADLRTDGRLGLLAPADGEHAEVRVIEGKTFVSPWRMKMRVLAATVALRESPTDEPWDQFVSKKEAKRAAKQLARMRRREPDAYSFCHQSPWHVPIRWFVLFHDTERWLGEDGSGRVSIRYRTPVRRAMRRVELAIPTLRRSELGPIGELILDLHQWLNLFDPAAILELDYGALCELMSWDELDDDHSARDVHEALDALDQGEFPRSADIYQRVLSRWAEVRSREIFN